MSDFADDFIAFQLTFNSSSCACEEPTAELGGLGATKPSLAEREVGLFMTLRE